MATAAPPQQTLSLVPTRGFERRFVVARNPDPESSLPYLLRIPVGDGLVLKAAEPWPLSARVYCHPVDAPDPDLQLDALQDVAYACARGAAGRSTSYSTARGTTA